ncbi:MAG: PIN domain-containing protein [Pirellulaceae bacterium]|nr:PIN domain-containing protein [Pirellulaceae bacterium]
MILVDTSILVDSLRSSDPKISALLDAHGGVVCGVVLAELLHGVRTSRERGLIIALVATLGSVPFDDALWEDVGDNLAALRRRGISVPLSDAIIATLAIELGIELWTRDSHFTQMQTVLSALRLFQEPP